MSVEQVGPGSVSNSYGVRTTKSKLVYDNTDAYQDVFIPTGSVPVTAVPSESGRTYEVAGIDVTDELTGGVGTLSSGTYTCDVGTRTWTGTIKPAILTITPGAGGTAYIEATEDGTTWVAWSEGVVSAATTARLAGPVVGLRVISATSASTLGVVV